MVGSSFIDTSFDIWLHGTKGEVVHLLVSGTGSGFGARMFPEQITQLEQRFDIEIDHICSDTEDNVMWRVER